MFLAIAGMASAQQFETAREATQKMKIGWNLGNTLDSHSPDVTDPEQTEILRGQPKTTQELMQMMRLAGFNAIRVPVTWYPHLDEEGTIDPMWMARVREVVDYVLDEGMYCIIDLHHDTGKSDDNYPKKGWIRATMANYNENHELFEKIWTQIATEFRDYGELLIFEGYNEMLDDYNSYEYASFKTENRYDEAVAQDAYAAINAYAKAFVETVRATGGNNTQRNLVINTYAACSGYGFWSERMYEPLENLELPEQNNHIMVGVHCYPSLLGNGETFPEGTELPYYYLSNKISSFAVNMKNLFINKNIPLIVGELNTANVDKTPTDYQARKEMMLWYMTYFVGELSKMGIPCFYWMGLSNKEYREMPAFNQADMAETLIKAAYGEDYQSIFLTDENYIKNTIVYMDNIWGEVQLAYDINGLQNEYKAIELDIEDLTSVGNGLLTLRAYTTNSDDSRNNVLDIIESSTTLNLEELAQYLENVVKVTIVWRTQGRPCEFKVLRAQLVKHDGTKEDCTLTIKTPERAHFGIEAKPLYAMKSFKDNGYATLYNGFANLTVPQNVTATAYNVVDNQLNVVKTYNAGTTIPVATGVVVKGEPNTIQFFPQSNQNGEQPTGSMMKGSDKDETTTGGERYFIFSTDSDNPTAEPGFYYAQPNGAPFINKAHKAYLALPANTAGIERYLLSEATSINTTINTATDTNTEQWMTIDGRKLNKKPTRQGLYIHNGQKIAVR